MSIVPEFINLNDFQFEGYYSVSSAEDESGFVYCTPSSAGRKVLWIDIRAKETREIGPELPAGYYEPVMGSNGAAYALPQAAEHRVLEIHPNGQVAHIGPVLQGTYRLLVKATEKLIAVPGTAAQVLVIDRGEVRFIGPDLNYLSRDEKYWGSAAVGSKVVGVPCFASRIIEVDAESEEVRTIVPDFDRRSATSYASAVAANGKVYGLPHRATLVLEYDPATSTARWIGPDLGPPDQLSDRNMPRFGARGTTVDNKIYCIPINDKRVLEIDAASSEVRLIGPDLRVGLRKRQAKKDGNYGSAALRGKVYAVQTTSEGYQLLEVDAATSAVRFVGPTLAGPFQLVTVENTVLMVPGKGGPAKLLHFPAPSPVQTIGSYMAKLAWEPKVWDVVVACVGEEFKGSSIILGRVPFFEAALSDGFQEGTAARVDIGDAGVVAFRAVWHYIYTDDTVRVAELSETVDLMDALSLAQRFELPVVAQACSRRLVELVASVPATVLLRIFRAAKLHELLSLRASCHQRIGEIGADFLMQEGVFDLLRGDEVLYNEVVSAATKRRRTSADVSTSETT